MGDDDKNDSTLESFTEEPDAETSVEAIVGPRCRPHTGSGYLQPFFTEIIQFWRPQVLFITPLLIKEMD